MPAESPTQTVQRLFPLLAEGRSAEAAALFADSVSFSVPHPPGIPWVPEVDSADGMRTFFELLQTHAQAKEFDLRQVVAEGEDVVLIGRMVSQVKQTSTATAAPAVPAYFNTSRWGCRSRMRCAGRIWSTVPDADRAV
ncbi:nuclear transport factor 2 family protein [Streptomyces canus]|uniref:nuclear transport factor 2 family protein n=1 Tax=Streptomyces canus TaxID=58343 RepID=UPI002252C3E3|nr:nuclear transport factor 2 family protein [Streptomyces canus]MCX4852766.1 nuclear transport factor 2 family protein [Streptomyces canus]WSW32071.1 nuclear transport factor 2 family protein [Streptomyces canus]